MEEEEAQRTYASLLGIVRGTKGLEWVAAQVEQLIALGHLEVRQVAAGSGPDEDDDLVLRRPAPAHLGTPRRPRRTASYTESVEYTGQEKLLILVDAVARATVGAAIIEREVAALASAGFPVELERDVMATAELAFIDEGSDRRVISTHEARAGAADTLQQLHELFEELRAATHAA